MPCVVIGVYWIEGRLTDGIHWSFALIESKAVTPSPFAPIACKRLRDADAHHPADNEHEREKKNPTCDEYW